MLPTMNSKFVDVRDWDELVVETYGRPYTLQQQDGCMSRRIVSLIVPSEDDDCDYENDAIPEVVNHNEMGVSFKAWLARDPEQPLTSKDDQESWSLDLWWDRNFYPSIDAVAADLFQKGLIEAGDYSIVIDW